MNRRGMALLLVLAALAALGVVAGTGVALAVQESALGRGALAEVRARAAAEGAIAEAFRGWSPDSTPFTPGDSLALAVVTFPGPAVGRAFLVFLGGPVFALRARGQTLGGEGTVGAGNGVELLVRVDSAGPDSLVRPRPITRGWQPIP